ncbi:MAG: hypothetical protein A3K90_04500 [Pelodictyon luteolum]|uniref:Chlorosome envelope protein B n=1 Tax=Pelodictyon luteolum TaxID=1100 RepID=A0A165MCF7_PELLU|nr:chlorosome envelope protein B [Pelodictyon luteolum]KZK75079.1 MAG: hypothetical protein A3K90_04500 [Pelodictyon luteolum]
MANETNVDVTKTVNDLMGAVGKIGQMQVDIVTQILNSAASAVEPLGKTASELVGNLTSTLTSTLQNVTSSINPQK